MKPLGTDIASVFDILIVTAASENQARAFTVELEARIFSIPVVVVPDPAGKRVGSGGATLNALDIACKTLSEKNSFPIEPYEVLTNRRVLILHSGGDSRRIPSCSVRGKAFCSLPRLRGLGSTLDAPFDLILDLLTRICSNAPPGGVFVACTDVLLIVPGDVQWAPTGATSLAIPSNAEVFGPKHGVFVVADCQESPQRVSQFMQKATSSELTGSGAIDSHGDVLLDSGVLYLSASSAFKFLSLAETPPFTGSTLYGLNLGFPEFRFELYSDVLLQFEYNEVANPPTDAMEEALSQVFGSEPLFVTVSRDGLFGHVGTTREYIEIVTQPSLFRDAFELVCLAHAFMEKIHVPVSYAVQNSFLGGTGVIGKCAVIEHSRLLGDWSIAPGSLCSSVRSVCNLKLASDMVIQELKVNLPNSSVSGQYTFLIYGVFDDIKGSDTFCNKPLNLFLERACVSTGDVWPDIPQKARSIWNARLFPVLNGSTTSEIVSSLISWMQDLSPSINMKELWRSSTRMAMSDTLAFADASSEVRWRNSLIQDIDIACICSEIKGAEYRLDIQPLLAGLDSDHLANMVTSLCATASTSGLGIASRALFVAAEALLLNNQPDQSTTTLNGQNSCDPLYLLMTGFYKEGLNALSCIQSSLPFDEAATLYQKGAQLLLRARVENMCNFQYQEIALPGINESIVVDCPARLDLAGGWSDTFPITTDLQGGGNVVNLAISIDGRRPIGARCSRLGKDCLYIDFYIGSSSAVRCTCLADFRDYSSPSAPAALLKSVLVALGVILVDSKTSFTEQIMSAFGGGIEVHTWSDLPVGSGLGTSSILASAVAKAIGVCSGKHFSRDEITTVVLLTEQLLSTGGGWQDQVGAVYPGFKVTSSHFLEDRFSLFSKPIDTRVDIFENHCCLIYTGVARLAKNLLTNVLKNWSLGGEEVCTLFSNLVSNAKDMELALESNDIQRIGSLILRYWELKKEVCGSSSVEPEIVSSISRKLNDLIHGYCLMGAGGGGFMLVVTKNPIEQCWNDLQEILQNEIYHDGVTLHRVGVDQVGIS